MHLCLQSDSEIKLSCVVTCPHVNRGNQEHEQPFETISYLHIGLAKTNQQHYHYCIIHVSRLGPAITAPVTVIEAVDHEIYL